MPPLSAGTSVWWKMIFEHPLMEEGTNQRIRFDLQRACSNPRIADTKHIPLRVGAFKNKLLTTVAEDSTQHFHGRCPGKHVESSKSDAKWLDLAHSCSGTPPA